MRKRENYHKGLDSIPRRQALAFLLNIPQFSCLLPIACWQYICYTHGMCNELHFSSEVALAGSSWHLWLRHEVEVVPHRQSAAGEEREGAGSRQGFFALLMHSEGEGTVLK